MLMAAGQWWTVDVDEAGLWWTLDVDGNWTVVDSRC